MGQRVNYIIKERDKLTIHYNHWRANSIAGDLYLGEKKFLKFVAECRLDDEIINEPWIEGCVIVDQNRKELFFWSCEFSRNTSVVNFYLKKLSKKWENWKISILKNRMYDTEKVLNIDYISRQKLQFENKPLKDNIISDKIDEWITALIIIKQDLSLFVTMTGNLNIEGIISYGQEIIPLIKDKPQYVLPKEGEEENYECIIIDEDNKKVFISESTIGLVETYKDCWIDYDLIIGDFGYIEMLHLGEIETIHLQLSENEIKKQFSEIIQLNDSFNPYEVAKKLKQDINDLQFNPDFFDNVRPKKSFIDKLKIRFKKFHR